MEQNKAYGNLIEVLDVLDNRDASTGDMWHSMIRYLDVRAREKGIPLGGGFELTPSCNLDCKMCYVHLSDKQIAESGKKILTGDQWINLIDQAVDAGMMHAVITGGEAMLHPEFDRIYLHLLDKGILLTVNTNGILLTEKRIEFFKKHPPKMIQISLYGANEDEYENITGQRVYAKVINAVNLMKKSELFFEVGITPNRYMKSSGGELLELLDSMGVFYSMNGSLFKPREGTEREREEHDISLDEYIELYKARGKLRGREYTPICMEDVRPVGGGQSNKPKGFRCAGGRSSFAITWDGKVHPCLMMTEIGYDLSEISFLDAWKRINHEVKEYPFPQECEGCVYRNVCTVCIKRHAEGAPIGHANKRICERAQRLALEGMIKQSD